MNHITPLKKELLGLNQEQLITAFNSGKPRFGKMYYFPIFARSAASYKSILFSEVIDEKNTKPIFRTIKNSWLIAISVLDHCEDVQFIKEFIQHIKQHWETTDYEDFLSYVSKNERFAAYF
jgi:hypothetical protein